MASFIEIVLLNALLAGLLAVLAFLAARSWQKPALAHALWVLVLLKLVTPPVIDVPVGWRLIDASALMGESRPVVPADEPKAAVAPKGSIGADQERIAATAPVDDGGARVEAASRPVTSVARPSVISTVRPYASDPRVWLAALGSIWLAGALGWFAGQLLQVSRFARVLRRAELAPPEVQAQTRQIVRAIGLRRCPIVRLVPGTVSPMLYAFSERAQLLFPKDLLSRLDVEARETLLIHELAHYLRRDHWVRLLEMVVTGLFWWHPAVWLARRGIEASEEECCDAWVVAQFPGTPRRYAEALLATVDFLASARPMLPPAASGLGTVPLLKHRLVRIMQGTAPHTLSPGGRCAVLLLACITLVRPVEARPTADTVLGPVAELLAPASLDREPEKPPASTARPKGQGAVASAAASNPAPAVAPPVRPEHWATVTSPDGKATIRAGEGHRVLVQVQGVDRPFDLSIFRISTVAFASDGRTFLAGSDDGTLRLLRIEADEVVFVAPIGTHGNAVASVALSPDGTTAASGGSDGDVRLWDIEERRLLGSAAVEMGPVGSVRFSPDGRQLAAAAGHWLSGNTGQIVLLDVPGRRIVRTFETQSPPGAIAFHPEGAQLIVGEWNGRLTWLDLETGAELAVSSIDKDRISSAAFSADAALPTDMPPPPAPAAELDSFPLPFLLDWAPRAAAAPAGGSSLRSDDLFRAENPSPPISVR